MDNYIDCFEEQIFLVLLQVFYKLMTTGID